MKEGKKDTFTLYFFGPDWYSTRDLTSFRLSAGSIAAKLGDLENRISSTKVFNDLKGIRVVKTTYSKEDFPAYIMFEKY